MAAPNELAPYVAAAARRGWASFPVAGKNPLNQWGTDATDHPNPAAWPSSTTGYGIACGPSHLLVIDTDSEEAEATFQALLAAHGEPDNTFKVRTAKGYHRYYADPEGRGRNSASKIAPGIDTRGDGGFVVGPGSLHPSGVRYELVCVIDSLPTASPWVLELLAKPDALPPGPRPDDAGERGDAYARGSIVNAAQRVLAAPVGQRNNVLNREAHSLARTVAGAAPDLLGMARDEMQAAALAIGLGAEETANTLDSAFGAGASAPKPLPPEQPRRLRSVPPPPDPTDPGPSEATGTDDGATVTPIPRARRRASGSKVTHAPFDNLPLTDVGNAERLEAAHGNWLRWVPQWGEWIAWDGRRWNRDIGEVAVQEAAKDVARRFVDQALELPDGDERSQVLAFALRTETKPRLEAMVSLARSTDRTVVNVADLDADPWLLNCANGTLDLRTGQLRSHDQENLLTKLAPTVYDPAAEAPTWTAFLERVQPELDVRAFLQRAAGYSAIGTVQEHVLLINYGGGNNGKTTFIEAIDHALGDYATTAEPELLLAKNDAAHPTGMADLHGARFVVTAETDDGRRLAEATTKRLTGGDTVKARRLYKDFFSFTPTHTLWMMTNHAPQVRGTDVGIWRRLRVVPWDVKIPDAEVDKALPSKLAAESSGVLAWIVEGALAWQRHGLGNPPGVAVATDRHKVENDVVGRFLEDECVLTTYASVSARDLYKAYERWCEDNGERTFSQKRLGMTLNERGLTSTRMAGVGRVQWLGIGLITASEELS